MMPAVAVQLSGSFQHAVAPSRQVAEPRKFSDAVRSPAGTNTPAPSLERIASLVASTAPDVLLEDRAGTERRFRAAARPIVQEARRADPVRAERLIVALRQSWNALPEVRRVSTMERELLWTSLVSVCIEEFYSPSEA